MSLKGLVQEKNILLCVCFFVITLVLGFVTSISPTRAAGNASFSVSPNSGTYTVGDTIVATIYEDSGAEPVNAVEVGLRFNASHLQVQSVDASQSAFALGVGTTNEPGYFSTTRAAFSNNAAGEFKNKQVVVKVVFKVLAPAGTTAVNFDSSSTIASKNTSQNIWNGQSSAANYSLQNTSQPDQPQSSAQSTPQPQPQQSSSRQSSKNNPVTSSGTSPSQPGTNPSQTQNDPEQPAEEEMQRGYLVVMKVLDSKGNPVKDATVTLETGESVQTDKEGLASFVGIAPGTYEVAVLYKGQTKKSSITVSTLSDPAQNLQEFEVKVEDSPFNTVLFYGAIAVGSIIVIGLCVWWLLKRRSARKSQQPHYYVDPSTIIASGTPSSSAPSKEDQITNQEDKK